MDDALRLEQALFSRTLTSRTDVVDIFRISNEGPYWLECSETIEVASSRIQQLGQVFPGLYMLSDSKTGMRRMMKCGR